MAKAKRPAKNNFKSLGLIALGSMCVVAGFIAIFLSTNNISISLSDIIPGLGSSEEGNSATAATKARKSQRRKKLPGHTVAQLTTNEGVNANVDFDRNRQRLNLIIVDRHSRPIPQLKVIARISRVGERHHYRSITLRENSTGEFDSSSLNLPDGGWVLSISAYNLFNQNFNKVVFHSEQSIFLGNKS